MAIVIRGVTRCPVCGGVLSEHDAVVGFPPVVFRESDAKRMSDAAAHESCLTSEHFSEAALAELTPFVTHS